MKSSEGMLLERPAALRDQAVSKLRSAIVNGQFKPGVRLVEREICDLLGVSRTVVREALRQLAAEGWVHFLPHRGPVVITMSPDDVRDLYEVYSALEGVAAQRAAERATPEQLDRLAKSVVAMTKAQRRNDSARHGEELQDFYDTMREASGNAYLRAQLEAMSSRMAWLRSVTLAKPERAADAVKEEARLLEAIQARDGKKARELCEAHLHIFTEAAVSALVATSARDGVLSGY